MGLPGSGKSYFVEHQNEYDRKAASVDVDTIAKYRLNGKDLFKVVADECLSKLHHSHYCILDGLYLTNESILKQLVAIKEDWELRKSQYNVFEFPVFQIVYWEPDREKCLINDRNRRDQNSTLTIKNAKLEEPDLEYLKEFDVMAVKKKTVVQKPKFVIWAQGHAVSVDKDNKMSSAEWSMGGTWGNYTGASGTLEADPQPASFKEFDDLIYKINPDMGFLRYKKLYNDTVTIVARSEGDYYGGSCTYARFVCDLEKLYNQLKEMDVIKEE
jgi:hypothetical protein